LRQYQQTPHGTALAQDVAVAVADLAAGGRDDPHVLVAADERVLEVALVVGAGVLLGLAPIGVLVRPADARQPHPEHHGTGLRVRDRELAHLETPGRCRHHGSSDRHGPSLLGRVGGRFRV